MSPLYAVVLCLATAACLQGAVGTGSADSTDDFAGSDSSQLAAADVAGLADKRQWKGNMRVWGKRADDGEADVDKRKWGGTSGSMRVWGKRTADELAAAYDKEEQKRKWGSNMRVWGKRGDDDEVLSGPAKKSWDSESLRQWGKRAGERDDGQRVRKWSQNNMRVWGKRADDSNSGARVRKWSQNNMRVWGKRSGADGADEKRKWTGNNMRVWGKRNDDEKRKWAGNNMRVWGKRADVDVKRGWAQRSMPVWGKRSASPATHESFDFPLPAKRSWQTNNMRIWGKRATDDGLANYDIDTDSVAHVASVRTHKSE